MLRLTFDWNCLIAVENGGFQAEAVKDLIEGHKNNEFEVALLAVSASEALSNKVEGEKGKLPSSARQFKERVAKLGWQDLPLLLAPATIGLTYIGLSVISDPDRDDAIFNDLWRVMAPQNMPRDPNDTLVPDVNSFRDGIGAADFKKWRNTWCDVMSAFCHVGDKRDVFVTTNTKDFQRKIKRLSQLGM